MTVVTLNGRSHELREPATVEDAVPPPPERLTGAVWPWRSTARWSRAAEWATTEVRDGQQVEVLRAVQGGS